MVLRSSNFFSEARKWDRRRVSPVILMRQWGGACVRYELCTYGGFEYYMVLPDETYYAVLFPGHFLVQSGWQDRPH